LEELAMELTHILTHLIALTQRNRVKAEELGLKKMLSPKAWLDEWGTVRIGSTRQSGHSTAIAHATKLFNEPLVIVPHEVQVRDIRGLFDHGAVTSAYRFSAGVYRGCRIDAIFVDCASYTQQMVTSDVIIEKKQLAGFWADVRAHLEQMDGLLILVG
jgi:hypothetical protein